MTVNPIVASQRELLRRLQALTDKDILVQRHLKNVWHPWQNDYPNSPFQTRCILSNELPLDMDTRNWEMQKREGKKLIAFLEHDEIPFYMAFSGGKSMHYHIFLDKNTIAFPEGLYKKLKDYTEIDVPCLVREYLTNYIVAKAGIDSEIAELDYSNISWSKDSHGSMIRIEGCHRRFNDPDSPGKFYTTFKTVVEEIPLEKPDAKAFSLPLKFPEKIELWNISYLQNDTIKLLESKIDQWERNQALMKIQRLKRLTTLHIHSRRKCLGFKRAEEGVPEGIRDFVCMGLICACKKWLKMNMDECRTFMHDWNARCRPSFPQQTIDYKVGRIFGMEKAYSTCGFFKKAGLCQGAKCSVINNKGVV